MAANGSEGTISPETHQNATQRDAECTAVLPEQGPEAIPNESPVKQFKPSSVKSSDSSFLPASITSTVAHQQTPFVEFQAQVKQLCQSLWPPFVKEHRAERLSGAPNSRLLGRLRAKTLNRFLRQTSAPNQHDIETSPPKEFSIERMSGGTYNRIVGISISDSEGEDPVRLVLRLPRIPWDARPDREVATLDYIRQHTSIPVPEIKVFDFTDENPVKSPFVVQHRVPGIELSRAISNGLSHKQWCMLARQVGQIVLQLHGVTNPTPGLIEAATPKSRTQNFKVVPFDIRNKRDMEWKEKQAKSTTLEDDNAKVLQWYGKDTLNFFATQFGRWRAKELTREPTSILWRHQMQRLADVASAMNRLGVFGNNENCLAHLDLAPRNIMVQVDTDESIQIIAVLDWDSAVFAPKLVSCHPPWWLWQDEKYDSVDAMEDETYADDELDDPELLEVKNLFEDIVGDDWFRCAYQTPFRLARRLFKIAVYGNHSNETFEEINNIVAEWAAWYKSEVEDYVSEDDEESSPDAGNHEPEEVFET